MSKLKFLSQLTTDRPVHEFSHFDNTQKFFKTKENGIFSVKNFQNAVEAGLIKEESDDKFSFDKKNSFVNTSGVTIITDKQGNASGKW